jgi:hypothetical protein
MPRILSASKWKHYQNLQNSLGTASARSTRAASAHNSFRPTFNEEPLEYEYEFSCNTGVVRYDSDGNRISS